MDITLTPKMEAMFQAVDALMMEGMDVNHMTVAQITNRAGIGKGTAYEYFANKEELIAGALLYKIGNICREVQAEMEACIGLREKICCLLDAIDRKEHEKACLLRVVNIVTDTSPISRQIEAIMKSYAHTMYMPKQILDYLIACAEKENGRPEGFSDAYTKLNVAARLLAYTMYSLSPRDHWDCRPEEMYRMVCDGICGELGVRKFN